ncbi:cysteine-type endopeptidase, separase [Pseudohyphozyma bogoriensis]|nr:cysteine-type endopeptidase, separase [Pseudohyphozyma bogoriensis]
MPPRAPPPPAPSKSRPTTRARPAEASASLNNNTARATASSSSRVRSVKAEGDEEEDGLVEGMGGLQISTKPKAGVRTTSGARNASSASAGGGTKRAPTTATAGSSKPTTSRIASTKQVLEAKTEDRTPLDPPAHSRHLMRSINTALSSLSSLSKSSLPPPAKPPVEAEGVEKGLSGVLKELRELVKGGEVGLGVTEVERAGVAGVGALVEMRMTRKVLLLYGRIAEAKGTSSVEIGRNVVEGFERLVEVGGKVEGEGEAGKKWVEVCEVVVYIARRANDRQAVERISLLIDPTSGSARGSPEPEGAGEVADVETKVAGTCARLMAVVAGVEKGEPLADHLKSASILILRLFNLRSAPNLIPASLKKIDHSLEKVRSAIGKAVRGNKRLDELVGKNEGGKGVDNVEALKVLETIVAMTEKLEDRTQDQSLDAVDTLLLLSYARLQIPDRTTYSTSFTSLERTLPLLSASLSPAPALALRKLRLTKSNAHAVRLVASAYYNVGGMLFNDGRVEAAGRFGRRAAEFGRACGADEEGMEVDGEEEDGEVRDAKRDLREHAGKRWELVGLAAAGVGDKQSAYEAYVSAVTTQPPSTFTALSSTLPALLPHSSPLSKLYQLVQRVTRLGTYDLLKTESLKEALEDAGRSGLEVAGALEMQLVALEGVVERREGRVMVGVLVEELLKVYSVKRWPLRRARTLVRKMQHQCSLGGSSRDLSVEACAAEIEKLCSLEDFANDAPLRPFIDQYLAFSHIYLAFHAHQSHLPESSETTGAEAKAALRILKRALDADIPPSPSAPKKVPPKESPVAVRTKAKEAVAGRSKATGAGGGAAGKTTTTRSAALAFKTPQVSRTLPGSKAVPKAELVTPPSRSALDGLERPSERGKEGEASPLRLDDPEGCFATLESLCQLLGAMGFTLLRIAYLQFLRRLSSRLGARSNIAFISISSYLGDEYARLGKTHRAGLVFAQADHRIQQTAKNDSPIPSETQVRYLTLYAGYLATLGNHDRSAKAYSDALDLADLCGDDETATSSSARILERTRLLQRAAAASATCSQMLQRKGYVNSLIRLASLYAVRGPPKSAEYYAQTAIQLAAELGATRTRARALIIRAEVRIRSDHIPEAVEDLDLIDEILGETACPEAIEAQRLRADLHMRNSVPHAAQETYLAAQKALDDFVLAAAEGSSGTSPQKQASPSRAPAKFVSPGRSPRSVERPTATSSDVVLPGLQAYLLRVQVALLRMQNKTAESAALLQRLTKLGVTDEDRADELKLLASIRFQELLLRFGADPVLGMLPESVLSVPTLSVVASKPESPKSGPSLVSSLQEIDRLLGRAVALSQSRSEPAKLRELSLLVASLRAFQSSVGKPIKRAAVAVSSVLDLGLAVTLRREMLEAIEAKLAARTMRDDLIWPTLEIAPSPPTEEPMINYWTSIQERYRSESADVTLVDPNFSTLLPPNWSVVSLHLSTEKDCLVLVRHRRDSEPLVFKLPLDRVARREGEDESFTYAIALEELQEIIAGANDTARRGKAVVDGKDERSGWWKERRELDARLKCLTETMEEAWLGAFKSVFLDSRRFSPEVMAEFKAKVEKILKRGIVRSQDKKVVRFKLDDSILSCLAALPPSARDEDLEDLYYFVMESFQFTGVPVSYDETDVDQVVVDLRDALEALHTPSPNAPPTTTTPIDEHIFLLLDKSLQSFPWESLPVLRSRSVSRIPSLAFLRDRIDLAEIVPTSEQGEILVDSTKTTVVLNPAGDLKNTQTMFEPWLERMKDARGWNGIVGRAPLEEEMRTSLLKKDLVIYFGHGGAEQYLRSQTIRQLSRCAVTMLWGCSSSLLKDLGDYDPVGTPYHYMIAGCPALVGNLWDVTDRDIDKFSDSVFKKIHLDVPSSLSASIKSTPPPTLSAAVATSRDVCNLKFLNGAAPVVFGVPVRFV